MRNMIEQIPESVIILAIGTITCLLGAWISKEKEAKATFMITAIIFLFLIGSHVIFNPKF